jgi:thymidylate synthase
MLFRLSRASARAVQHSATTPRSVQLARTFSTSQPREFATAVDMYEDILAKTEVTSTVRNYTGTITNMQNFTIESDLFDAEILNFYSKHNLNLLDQKGVDAPLYEKFYTAARGGGQGDYRRNMEQKIDNVVSSLSQFASTKRAVMTIPSNADSPDHTVDDEAKCLRELHFYLEPSEQFTKLHCTGFMRAQASTIFPKNVHFIGTLINTIAERLGVEAGSYTHFVTTMVNARED